MSDLRYANKYCLDEGEEHVEEGDGIEAEARYVE